MLRKTFPLPAAALLAVAAAAMAQAPGQEGADGILVDAKGMTLYTFDNDAGGKSVCNGPCATNWPPLMAGADAKPSGDWTIITRDDGAQAVGVQGQAAVPLGQGREAGRQDRRRRSTTSGTSPSALTRTRRRSARRSHAAAIATRGHDAAAPPTRRCRTPTCSRRCRGCGATRAC